MRTGTERIQNGYENANGTGTERVQNGYRTDTKRKWNAYGAVTNHKNGKKSVLQNANYKRTRSSEHTVVSYTIRVLTEDLEMM